MLTVHDFSLFIINFGIFFVFSDLVQDQEVTVYSHPDVSNYALLRLDIPRQQLLVGAK